jgi:hypothetical protein
MSNNLWAPLLLVINLGIVGEGFSRFRASTG